MVTRPYSLNFMTFVCVQPYFIRSCKMPLLTYVFTILILQTAHNDDVYLYDCDAQFSRCSLFYAISGEPCAPNGCPSFLINFDRNLKVVFRHDGDGLVWRYTFFNATVKVASRFTTMAPRTTTVKPATSTTTWPVTTATQPPIRCGEPLKYLNYSTDHAYVVSPNYPQNYDNHEHCEWEFMSPNGTQIMIEFIDFEVSMLCERPRCKII